MHKKYLVVSMLVIILGLLIGVGYSTARNKTASAPSTQSQTSNQLHSQDETVLRSPKNSEEITRVGTMDCLPLADTSGPQTMECALGMKLDDGTYYALAGDTALMMGIATGQRIEATGTVSEPTSTKYKITGIFNAQALTKL